MRVFTKFNIKRNKKILVSDMIKFFEVRGYTLSNAHALGLEFRRGNILGSLTSLNPLKWKTKVTIEVIKKYRMDYDLFVYYDFSTLGQFITSEEKKYFAEEANAFQKAIEKFQVDEEKAVQLAQKVADTNYRYLFQSFPIGIILSLAIIFLININLSGSLSILFSSGIAAAAIIFSYFFLTWIKKI